MPSYLKLGKVPPKRHIQFYKEDGKSLYREELVSSLGFSGVYSNLYHIHMPPRTLRVEEIETKEALEKIAWDDAPMQYYHFFTEKKKSAGTFITARVPYLYNAHCVLSTANVTQNSDEFFRNALAHEYIFVHHGKGVLHSEFGRLAFESGDQIIIPKGMTYQMTFEDFINNKLLVIESDTAFDFPKHYRNESGQLEEHAPLSERDLKQPEFAAPIDKMGEFKVIVRMGAKTFRYTLDHHPFDVVGWDGCLYPFAFNIKNYDPKVGRIHLPPPVHLLFKTEHFVVCNFCPRPFDFHPQAVPVPYFHHNIDSDEVLYYAEGDFMSRKGVEEGSITLHPMGITHGPQPGKTEASLGAKETQEYAVMLDTFAPLKLTKHVKDCIDERYTQSWLG